MRTPLLLLLAASSTALALPPLPSCAYADLPAPSPSTLETHLTLVDTRFRLPAEYVPPDLVPVRQAGLPDDRTLRAGAVRDLGELIRGAAAAGIGFDLQSAYRSHDYQSEVFTDWVEALGREQALRVSARPGHSEHQLGTAVDLRSAGGPAPWSLADWAQTAEGAWLKENAWRYGFAMSYPAGKESVTCYDYEPWHYRWLGKDVALELRRSGLTIREWLWQELHETDRTE